MKAPWSHADHIAMHWRPDAVMKTGVIEPMWIRQVSPVDMARHTIDPFIDSVRGRGPAVSPSPEPEQIAAAAAKVAKQFAEGKDAIIAVGVDKVRVAPGQGALIGGIVGLIAQAAEKLARGESVAIDAMGRRLIVRSDAAGNVQVQAASANAPRSGLGEPAAIWAQALRPTGPGAVYNYPAISMSDAPYRATMMASVKTWAPNVTAEVHSADRDPLYIQRTVPAAAMASRPALPAPYFQKAQTYAQQTVRDHRQQPVVRDHRQQPVRATALPMSSMKRR
jgi:hypothetical protein